MNREEKKNYITEMESQFQNNEAVLVTHYQGLTMTQLDELRSQMREHGIKFQITKNRITKLALEKTKCKDLSSLFTGATAVAFSDDAIISARILSKFSKNDIPVLHVLNIKSLTEKLGMPFAPIPVPEIGVGNLYAVEKYNVLVALICLIVLCISVFVVGYQSKKEIKEHLINHEPDSLL